ncbi:MAG: class I SAM-dependent methyltransferase [Dehalococcoidia bacterium]
MTARLREMQRLRRAYAGRRAGGREDRYVPFEPANLFRLQSLERAITAMLRSSGLLPMEGRTALDVGCGGGWWLRTLLRWGARPDEIAGIDALPEAIGAARRVHPDTGLFLGAADALPFADATFDLVTQFTVFSSMLDAGVRQRTAAEMLRVLRPGGMVLWYDFTVNPTNRQTRGIGAREAAALFPGCAKRLRRVTLAPPLARLVAPRSWLGAALLESIPPLRTHLLMLARKPAGRLTRITR